MYDFVFQSTLTGHKNIIKYVDSSITQANNGVYEICLLMQYCKGEFKFDITALKIIINVEKYFNDINRMTSNRLSAIFVV